MCGRFVSTTAAADLAAHFGATEVVGDLSRRWNVTPSSEVWVVHDEPTATAPAPETVVRRLEAMRWGLVPSWAKDPAIGNRMINARVETAASKPSFRSAFRRRRCLLPVDGFYEWAPVPGQRAKQPWYFTATNGLPLALAGLWEVRDPENPDQQPLRTCTILTTVANDLVAPVHDRMPVALPPAAWDTWLDPALDDRDAVEGLLAAVEPAELCGRRVGTAVGNPRNEGSSLIDAVD